MPRHTYTPEQKEYIRQIAPGRYNSEIAEIFNAKFGTKITEKQIKSFKKNHNIKSNVTRKCRTQPKRLFTSEQEKFIAAHVKGKTNKELTDLVNKRFGLSITVKQMKTWKKNHGYSSGLKGSEGMPPWNKGKKGLNIGGKQTQFKKGHIPKNYRPVGSERVNRYGYVEIKVADPNKWKLKHREVWESFNGPIPKGHAILFLNQNKLDIRLDNLVMVPQSKLSILNKKGLLHKDADLTKTGLIMADIYHKIGRLQREAK